MFLNRLGKEKYSKLLVVGVAWFRSNKHEVKLRKVHLVIILKLDAAFFVV